MNYLARNLQSFHRDLVNHESKSNMVENTSNSDDSFKIYGIAFNFCKSMIYL